MQTNIAEHVYEVYPHLRGMASGAHFLISGWYQWPVYPRGWNISTVLQQYSFHIQAKPTLSPARRNESNLIWLGGGARPTLIQFHYRLPLSALSISLSVLFTLLRLSPIAVCHLSVAYLFLLSPIYILPSSCSDIRMTGASHLTEGYCKETCIQYIV